MKVSGKTKNDYIVVATNEELNKFSGGSRTSYDFGDVLDVNPDLIATETLAADQAAFQADMDTMKTTIEGIENG